MWVKVKFVPRLLLFFFHFRERGTGKLWLWKLELGPQSNQGHKCLLWVKSSLNTAFLYWSQLIYFVYFPSGSHYQDLNKTWGQSSDKIIHECAWVSSEQTQMLVWSLSKWWMTHAREEWVGSMLRFPFGSCGVTPLEVCNDGSGDGLWLSSGNSSMLTLWS